MYKFITLQKTGKVALLTLNRPEVLNAWHSPMRKELGETLGHLNADRKIRAIVMTGAGDRAFSAGQDLNEAKGFDPDRAEAWVGEWRALYSAIRGLDKPLVAALNGVAAGSAFQVSLLTDIRVGHKGTHMGQPEINSGIASTLGPWIMMEMLGLSRTIDLTLTGRMMGGEECHAIGLIHYLVPKKEVLPRALAIAKELADKPPVAMRLDKQFFRESTQASFDRALAVGVRIQREAYGTGEPQAMMKKFFAERAKRR